MRLLECMFKSKQEEQKVRGEDTTIGPENGFADARAGPLVSKE